MATIEASERTRLEELRRKYEAERDRRVRREGEGQYVRAAGQFAKFMDCDPFAQGEDTRAPVTRHARVVIIGGGWAGLMTAARLCQQGVNDLCIVEDGSDFGGTWYWNRYPGAQCDIDSYCYLPLLEETGYIPKEKYSSAVELYEHAQRIGNTFGLYDKTLFRTRAQEARWDDAAACWRVPTDHGDSLSGDHLVLATGPTSRGKLPGIPGIDTFKGHMFHTIRWDFSYTGGDINGHMTGLADKRVGIIGTGATAVQAVPYLADDAKQLYVFQRTPSSVGVRGNKPTDPAWAATLEPGWQEQRQANFDEIFVGNPEVTDLVGDGLSRIFRTVSGKRPHLPADEAALDAELADMRLMDELRGRVDRIVEDAETAEALKPWYRVMCKRPCFNERFLETFNRPNVTLVDTSGSRGVERVTEHGVVVAGVEYPLDCLIFATGFENGGDWKVRFGLEILGQGGKSLYEHWSGGMRTFHGTLTHGFPNFYYVGPGQGASGFNYTTMADAQAREIAYIVRRAGELGARTIQPSAEGEAQWVATVKAHSATNAEFQATCTPGYYNSEGKGVEAYQYDNYAPGVNAFRALQQAWMDEGNMQGLERS